MITFTVSYQGGLRCEAVHGPSGTTLLTDAPRDNQGHVSGQFRFCRRSQAVLANP